MEKMISRLRSYQNGVHGAFFLEVAAKLEHLWRNAQPVVPDGFRLAIVPESAVVEPLRYEMKAIALALGRSKTDGESDCDWHAMADEVEDLVSRNENLEIEHDVMFCRLRDANGQYTPEEVSGFIDAEIKAKLAESV
ncbi:MAG: hypothetical protein A2Y38_24825 [Spirochaetes bacterium GWB1_59_5]|nr:MAG: hypothetical protein A2Y38_24825 [Spirochaetes bacterium GWB1_59_5]